MESKAIARFARIAPRKARVVVNLVRGQNVAKALDMLAFTRKSGAPIVKKLIESALANAKQSDSNVDVDGLFVTTAAVDKGPNKNTRRWRPRAMGRATKVTKGVSHIQITLTDTAPAPKARRNARTKGEPETATSQTTTPTAASNQ
jgi:large subunit ribosomal protein L22